MRNRNIMSKILVLILAGCMMISLAGCRNSPVLVQTVYEQDHETDEDTETKSTENEDDNEDQDEDLAPQAEVDDSDSKRDQSREDALNGDGDDQADQTYDSEYDASADTSGTASEGTSDQTSPEQNTGSGEDNESEAGGSGDMDDNSESGTQTEPTAEDEVKQVVDARGQYVDIPENVDTVTAVGEAAIIVEMLGGSGRLLASSASFTGDSQVQSAFSSQGVSSVQTWWDGDGSGTITSANFEALLAAKPDVCFEISGQSTFSSDQIAALEAAEIAYVVIHPFTSISNIESAVTIVGEVLGDKSADGGTNAPQIAQQYCSWAENIVSAVQGKGSAKTTLFISAWDESAYWEIKNNQQGVWSGNEIGSGSGYGVAIARKSASSAPLNECMGLANLTNRAVDNNYVVPLVNGYWLHYVTSGTGTFVYGRVLTKTTAGDALGNSTFPAVVVADSSIKTAIENDFRWGVYGTFTNQSTYAYSFNDGNGNPITSSIHGSYEIYVNPTGLASWTDGLEAPLEAAWLSYKFQSGEGGVSLDELRSMISEFYSTFYHISVDTVSILGE